MTVTRNLAPPAKETIPTTSAEIIQLLAQPLHAAGHRRLGRVRDVLLDVETGTAEWLVVATGQVLHAIPVAGVVRQAGALATPYTRAQVENSPSLPLADVSADDERSLVRYWARLPRPAS